MKTKTITMRLPEQWIESLKKEARKTSFKENKDFSHHDLIRSIIKSYISTEKK